MSDQPNQSPERELVPLPGCPQCGSPAVGEQTYLCGSRLLNEGEPDQVFEFSPICEYVLGALVKARNEAAKTTRERISKYLLRRADLRVGEAAKMREMGEMLRGVGMDVESGRM